MCNTNVLLLVILAFLISRIDSCMFKQEVGKMAEVTRNEVTSRQPYERKLFLPKCQCGKYDDKLPNYFLLHIHSDFSDMPHIVSCMAVAVASNMLLASHHCLNRSHDVFLPYHKWDVEHKVGTNFDQQNMKANAIPWMLEDSTKMIYVNIQEVIYHPRYMPEPNTATNNDVVILITKENLMHKGFNTLCLPESSLKTKDVLYHTGDYIGVGNLFPKDNTTETRFIENVVVMKARECEKEGYFGITTDDDNLCVRFRDQAPRKAGGALMVQSNVGADERYTLVGLGTIVGLEKYGTTIQYAYFSNIIPQIKYIERYAQKYGSLWCESRPYKPPKEVPPGKRAIILDPWEGKTIPPRDESLNCVCGLRSKANSYYNTARSGSPSLRISGGQESLILEFPWMIHLKVFHTRVGRFTVCGGSLINDRMVLTAAHCVAEYIQKTGQYVEFKPEDLWVYVRVHNSKLDIADGTNVPGPDNEAFYLEVSQSIVYPHYHLGLRKSFRQHESDIALLILTDAISGSVSQSIDINVVAELWRPICLPKLGENIGPLVGKTAILSGWGRTAHKEIDPNGGLSDVLKKSEYPIRGLEECANFTYGVITRNMICATSYDVKNSALNGDSGSPLSVELGKDKLLTQIGLTSFGDEFDDPDHPDIHLVFYTNVQRFLKFIDYYAAEVHAQWCQTSMEKVKPVSP